MRLQTATMMLLWFPPPSSPSLSLFLSFLSENLLLMSHKEGVSSDLLFTLIFLMVGFGWINFDLKEDFFFGYHPLKGRLKLNYTKAVIISIYHVGNETGRSAFTTIVFLRKKHHTVTVVSWGGKTKGKQGHFVGCNGKVQEKVLKWLFQ